MKWALNYVRPRSNPNLLAVTHYNRIHNGMPHPFYVIPLEPCVEFLRYQNKSKPPNRLQFLCTGIIFFFSLLNILSYETQSPDFKSLHLILRDKRDRVSLSRNRIKDHSLLWRHTNFRLLYVGTQYIHFLCRKPLCIVRIISHRKSCSELGKAERLRLVD